MAQRFIVGAMSSVKAFSVRLSSDDARRLDDLATHFAVNASSVVRMLLKREHDQLVSEQRIRKKLANARERGAAF